MKFINVIAIILLISLLFVGCGRPGGKGDENAPGSYLQVTKAELSGDAAKVSIKNRFKDPSVTTPNTMYDVTLTSYTVTYFNVNGTVIATKTNNNVLFIYIPVGGEVTDVSITLDPRPTTLTFSSAQMHIFGKNGFGDNIGTPPFYLPTAGSGGGTPPTPGAAPTVSSVSPSSGTAGTTLTVTISGTNFTDAATVSFSGTGITVNSTTFGSSTSLTVSITIDSTATLGSRDVTVTTSSGSGTGSGVFSVT